MLGESLGLPSPDPPEPSRCRRNPESCLGPTLLPTTETVSPGSRVQTTGQTPLVQAAQEAQTVALYTVHLPTTLPFSLELELDLVAVGISSVSEDEEPVSGCLLPRIASG